MNPIQQLARIHTKEGSGKMKPVPRRGFARFAFVFTTHYPKLFLLNLLIILFCIPVITAPAALIAANRVLFNLYYDGTSDVWSDFIGEWKAVFKESLLYMPVLALFFLLAYAFLALYHSDTPDGFSLFCMVAALLLFLYTWTILCYAFAMHAIVALPPKTILKNASLLAICEVKSNLMQILLPGLLTYIGLLFLPQSLPILLMLLFSVALLLSCTILVQPIEKRVITPFGANDKA